MMTFAWGGQPSSRGWESNCWSLYSGESKGLMGWSRSGWSSRFWSLEFWIDEFITISTSLSNFSELFSECLGSCNCGVELVAKSTSYLVNSFSYACIIAWVYWTPSRAVSVTWEELPWLEAIWSSWKPGNYSPSSEVRLVCPAESVI